MVPLKLFKYLIVLKIYSLLFYLKNNALLKDKSWVSMLVNHSVYDNKDQSTN